MEKVNLKKWTLSTEGQDNAKGPTHVYERVQAGSGPVGEEQQQTVSPNCPRTGDRRQHAAPLAQALHGARRASLSRQRTSDRARRGKQAVEARSGDLATGA